MRKIVHDQLRLVPVIATHQHMLELQEISRILDATPQATELVYADLIAGGIDPDKGREGLSGEQVLRAAIIKQSNRYSYEELAFHLADSMSYQWFCRLGIGSRAPTSSALQNNIKKVRPETMEQISQLLLAYANENGVEDGRKVRTDCTVTKSNIHEPSDSSLLWDCVRVLVRCLRQAQACIDVPFTDHSKRAKRRSIGINNAKKTTVRVSLYRDLIKVTEKTLRSAKRTVEAMEAAYPMEALESLELGDGYRSLQVNIELTKRIVDQARRRVLNGESVPVAEKIVSIFEPHTDIIVKGRRETLYGHKLCLTTGVSGLVLDCVIEDGNPADSTLAVAMIERQIKIYGQAPRQACFDGGFSSQKNLLAIKKLEVKDVAFSKSPGIALLDMVKSSWVYKRLKHFRAGIESNISFLKRCFGWDRCTWRSLQSFKAYTWTSIVAANLLVLARHALK